MVFRLSAGGSKMAGRTGGQAEYLYPNKDIPVPLPEDFYKAWLAGASTLPRSQGRTDSAPPPEQAIPSASEAIVEKLIKENQDLIEKEALKQAAAAALNVNAAQYTNLIPLSFDQDEFIRQEEEKRMKKRENFTFLMQMNVPPSFPMPQASNYQSDPEKMNTAISYLEVKAMDAKKIVEELLPDMLDKFSSLAAAMSQLQGALKKSAIQSGHEDHGALLRSHVLVPQRLQLEPDQQLQTLTSYRVHSWNHDVVPDYLRTKLNPEMESEEMMLEQDKNQKGQDVISKQITHLNKYVDLLLQSLHSSDRAHNENFAEKPTFNKDETVRLVRATMVGEGLKINMGRSASATSSTHTTTQLPRPSGTQPSSRS
ncbi:hypothetical protein ANCCEY_04726 [Ancylostoma ceylanicum]|uniref:Mediator of RNA polymerase II transcription subunit 8 n=1 Tax=Ancylostoma ceylanicum TaxID=53326 RepID=A0A0D6M1F8_9BILA|nr:hypothetical protein ANCCEY_04726 [Ancylostoma ceylanicum]